MEHMGKNTTENSLWLRRRTTTNGVQHGDDGGKGQGGNRRNQGGPDGGTSQGDARRDLEQEEPDRTQATAIMMAHGGADGRRSHGGGRANNSRGPTDGGGAGGGGARSGVGEPKIQGDDEDPED
ncbi:ABC transporter NFT1 [Labeo rohita]|uniref:ABC transporter NFT1 n=1 Tax=Labeo rohita TaxID=84645 RepID=A0ABQ8L2N2_LABRO|nr:ABC transporter NFT1 [Labeo rohita]